jgi:hypothetical protein
MAMTAAVIMPPNVKPKERIRGLRESVRTIVPDYPRSTEAGKLSAFSPELVMQDPLIGYGRRKETGPKGRSQGVR